MRVDVRKPRVDFGDPVRILRSLGLGTQRSKLGMRGQDGLKQRLGTARRFLRDMRDGCVPGKVDGAVVGVDFARDQAQQRGLAGAVAAHKPHLVPVWNARRGMLEQWPPLDAV